jgi:hypothetical protein
MPLLQGVVPGEECEFRGVDHDALVSPPPRARGHRDVVDPIRQVRGGHRFDLPAVASTSTARAARWAPADSPPTISRPAPSSRCPLAASQRIAATQDRRDADAPASTGSRRRPVPRARRSRTAQGLIVTVRATERPAATVHVQIARAHLPGAEDAQAQRSGWPFDHALHRKSDGGSAASTPALGGEL